METKPPFLPLSLSPWSKAEAAKFLHGELTDRIIACAIEVHRRLGPVKAARAIDDDHLAICLSYLKAVNLRVGLIINFAEAKTRVRRVMRGPDLTTEKGREGDLEDD